LASAAPTGPASATTPARALDNPAFTHLITVAGDKDKVAAYCADLLKTRARKPPTHPTGKPPTHPTGKATTHPTGAPSTRPSH
jgi:hypothetical protein